MIEAIAQANPRTVVVLHTSNPVSMPWLDKVAGVVEALYPGQEAGSSIARILFGDVNPSGRLAMTFPKDQHQGPASHFTEYPGDGMTANFDEGVLVGYRWYDAKGQEPLFPFGFGLSYTTFKYSDLQVSKAGDETTVKVKVTNSGKVAGAEIVQLYIGCPAAAEEPPKQLRGFDKVQLKPGESKTVTHDPEQGQLRRLGFGRSRVQGVPRSVFDHGGRLVARYPPHRFGQLLRVSARRTNDSLARSNPPLRSGL